MGYGPDLTDRMLLPSTSGSSQGALPRAGLWWIFTYDSHKQSGFKVADALWAMRYGYGFGAIVTWFPRYVVAGLLLSF